MSPGHRRQLARLLSELAAEIAADRELATLPELEAARLIACEQGKQTGKNRERFLAGDHDRGFGVKCALAGMRVGREQARVVEP